VCGCGAILRGVRRTATWVRLTLGAMALSCTASVATKVGVDAGDCMDAHAGNVECATDAGPCSGSVSFWMRSAGGQRQYSSSEDREPNWLAILKSDGNEVPISPSGDDYIDCVDGGPFLVPPGGITAALPDAGVTGSWNGIYYAPGPDACATPTCATPGHYIARMCGCLSSSEECAFGAPDTDCVTVPFVYPMADTVMATLPSAQ